MQYVLLWNLLMSLNIQQNKEHTQYSIYCKSSNIHFSGIGLTEHVDISFMVYSMQYQHTVIIYEKKNESFIIIMDTPYYGCYNTIKYCSIFFPITNWKNMISDIVNVIFRENYTSQKKLQIIQIYSLVFLSITFE